MSRLHERSIRWDEFLGAMKCSRPATTERSFPSRAYEQKNFQPGPIMAKARELYWGIRPQREVNEESRGLPRLYRQCLNC